MSVTDQRELCLEHEQLRGDGGRFVRERFSPQRRLILAKTREMRARMNLPEAPILDPSRRIN